MKEPKRINWIDCVGKVVSGVCCDDNWQLVVSFEDGTHCTVKVWHGYDCGGMSTDADLGSDDFGGLLKAGAIDQEFIDSVLAQKEKEKAEKKAAELRRKEMEERKEFERLRAKFEGAHEKA